MFSKLPIGPIGAHLTLTDTKWAVAGEVVLGQALELWIVDNAKDNRVCTLVRCGHVLGCVLVAALGLCVVIPRPSLLISRVSVGDTASLHCLMTRSATPSHAMCTFLSSAPSRCLVVAAPDRPCATWPIR